MQDELRLLIVDDDLSILEIMWNIASQIEGLSAEKTDQPLQAVELLKTMQFHLLLTDLVMPDLNGLELMIKARELHPDITVAVVTGFGDQEMAMGAIKGGAYGYVHKPFRPEELALILHNMLEKKRVLHRMKLQDEEISKLKNELNLCQQTESDLKTNLNDLQAKLDAIGVSTEKSRGDILLAINKAATKKVLNNSPMDISRELNNLNHLLEEKKITEEEFSRFRQHILKRTYGEE